MDASETGAEDAPGALRAASVPTVSVVIPAYNEARRIGSSIETIITFLNTHEIAAEIIVVDDGSDDGTSRIAGAYSGQGFLNIVNETNRGKGYSVRRGFLEAKGTYVLFTDADLSAPIDELSHLLEIASEGADTVIGSRVVDRSRIVIHQPRTRECGGDPLQLGGPVDPRPSDQRHPVRLQVILPGTDAAHFREANDPSFRIRPGNPLSSQKAWPDNP